MFNKVGYIVKDKAGQTSNIHVCGYAGNKVLVQRHTNALVEKRVVRISREGRFYFEIGRDRYYLEV